MSKIRFYSNFLIDSIVCFYTNHLIVTVCSLISTLTFVEYIWRWTNAFCPFGFVYFIVFYLYWFFFQEPRRSRIWNRWTYALISARARLYRHRTTKEVHFFLPICHILSFPSVRVSCTICSGGLQKLNCPWGINKVFCICQGPAPSRQGAQVKRLSEHPSGEITDITVVKKKKK